MSRVFANGPIDRGSIPGLVIPKTQKMVLDATLLNTQHYKVRIKGKVEPSREWGSAISSTLVLQLLKREPLGHPQLCRQLYFFLLYFYHDKVFMGLLSSTGVPNLFSLKTTKLNSEGPGAAIKKELKKTPS